MSSYSSYNRVRCWGEGLPVSVSLYPPPQQWEASTMFLKSGESSRNSLYRNNCPRPAPCAIHTQARTRARASGMRSKELSRFQAPLGSLKWAVPLEGLRVIEDRSWVREVGVAGPKSYCWGNYLRPERWRSRQGLQHDKVDWIHTSFTGSSQPSSPYEDIHIPFLNNLSLTSYPEFSFLNSELGERAMISGTHRLKIVFSNHFFVQTMQIMLLH